MRHRKAKGNLNRNISLRKATIRDIVRSVIIYEKVKTTKSKAKAARRLLERVISLGKQDTIFSRRRAFKEICDHRLVHLLFAEVAPRFKEKNSGYSRILSLGNRRGDNAESVLLELTEQKIKEKPKKQKVSQKEKAIARKPDVKEGEIPKKKEEQPQKEIKETLSKEKPKIKGPKPSKKFFGGLRKFLKKGRDSL